jgi:hypothetical protein
MASLARPTLLPQCIACTRRVTRLGEALGPLQQVRSKSKAAKEADRLVIVKLLQDVPKFGRAGTSMRRLRNAIANRMQAP